MKLCSNDILICDMIYKKSWKYILTRDDSSLCKEYKYFRIKAVKDFSDVTNGDLGGFVKSYHNLSQSGKCWIYDNALVINNAQVIDNAKVYDNAVISDNAKISENATISNYSIVSGYAKIYGNAQIYGHAIVKDNAKITDVRIFDTIVEGNEIMFQ